MMAVKSRKRLVRCPICGISDQITGADADQNLEDDMPNAAGDLFVDSGTEEKLSAAECKKMNRAASHLLEAAKRAVASTG